MCVPRHYRIFTDDFSCTCFTILMAIIMTYIVFPKGDAEGTLLVYWAGNSFRTCIPCPLNANHGLPQVINTKKSAVIRFQMVPRILPLVENYFLKEIVFIRFYMN